MFFYSHLYMPTACEDNPIDLVFVIDSSGSIQDNAIENGLPALYNYDLMKTFINSIVDALPISSNQIRVGVVYYSNIVNNYFYLNDPSLFNDKTAMKAAITAMP